MVARPRKNLLHKLQQDAFSVKLWLVALSTALLCYGKMDCVCWSAFVLGLLGLREASELRENVYGGKE